MPVAHRNNARVVELCPRRSEEHTSELQSQSNVVCRLLLEKKKKADTTQSNVADTVEALTPVHCANTHVRNYQGDARRRAVGLTHDHCAEHDSRHTALHGCV